MHEQAPALEVICGGVNSKTPLAGAVWRQGHLLHFGFEQSPAEMNERGRALLVNAICYIGRFTEDRPIVRSPSSFYSNKRVLDRGALDRLIRNPERDLAQYLRWMAAPEVREALQGLSRDELRRWLEENRGFLVADEQGHYVIDAEARKFGVPPDSEGFIPRAIEVWKKPGSGESFAERLLRRYVPEGPKKGATPDEWRKWWEENRPYIFYSDTGGYRWYVDPLAKKRQTPCSELRGTKRATGRPIAAAAAAG